MTVCRRKLSDNCLIVEDGKNSPSFLAPAWIKLQWSRVLTCTGTCHARSRVCLRSPARVFKLGNTYLRPNSWQTSRREKESFPRLQKIIQSNFELDSVTVFTYDTKCLFVQSKKNSIWRNKESLWTLDSKFDLLKAK